MGASDAVLIFHRHQEAGLANAVREGRCREFAVFGWKPEETRDPAFGTPSNAQTELASELTRAFTPICSIGIGS